MQRFCYEAHRDMNNYDRFADTANLTHIQYKIHAFAEHILYTHPTAISQQ